MRSKSVWAIRPKALASLAGSILLAGWVVSPVQAQTPLPQNLQLPIPSWPLNDSQSNMVAGCIRLDGRCLFQVAAPKSELPARIQDIQQRLENISNQYLQDDAAKLQVEIAKQNNLPVIFVNDQPVLTVTQPDANLQGADLDTRAQKVRESLQEGLIRAKQEREPQFITRSSAIAGSLILGMVVASWSLERWRKRSQIRLAASASPPTGHPVTTQLTQQQKGNLQEVQRRLYQLAQGGIWGGGGLIILGLFPYTRIVQVLALSALQVPLLVGIVGVGTYVGSGKYVVKKLLHR